MSRSRTKTLVVTLPPASRQTQVAALSSANPRLPNTPARAQHARWWPRASRRRPHMQKRREKRRGRRRRCNKSTRKNWGSKRVSGVHGVVKKATPAPDPLWDARSPPDCAGINYNSLNCNSVKRHRATTPISGLARYRLAPSEEDELRVPERSTRVVQTRGCQPNSGQLSPIDGDAQQTSPGAQTLSLRPPTVVSSSLVSSPQRFVANTGNIHLSVWQVTFSRHPPFIY